MVCVKNANVFCVYLDSYGLGFDDAAQGGSEMHVFLDGCELVSYDLLYCEYEIPAHLCPIAIVYAWFVDNFCVLGDEDVVRDRREGHCHLFFYGERLMCEE